MPYQLVPSSNWESVVLSPVAEEEAVALDLRAFLQKLVNRDEYLKTQLSAIAAVVSGEAAQAALDALLIAQEAQGLLAALINAKDVAVAAAADAQAALLELQALQDDLEALLQQVQDFLDGQEADVTIARRNQANTFTSLQTLEAGISVAGPAVFTGTLRVPVKT